jgi:transcriptional regulator with XRE-family HTH domain
MINQQLRAARKARRWSMQFASQQVGVDRVTYSRWELGEQNPHPSSLDMLCQTFGMSPEELGFGHLLIVHELQEPEELSMDQKRRELFKQALGMSAALTVPTQNVFSSSVFSQNLSLSDAMLIDHFGKLASICWDLLRVDGLPTVGQLLPTFLPEITELAQQPSTCQKPAAGLAAQGHILAGLVATLQLNHIASEAYCKKAVVFSRLSEDRTLEAAALKHLAVKYFDLKHPIKTLQTYQEVLPFIDEISPLMKSRTYLGLAAAYAQAGQEQEALRYLGMAQETFPVLPEADPACFQYPRRCHQGAKKISEKTARWAVDS